MISDCSAVAGFFEDLPILLIILSGVVTLVSTSAWVAAQLEHENSISDLKARADRLADHVVSRLRAGPGVGGLPLMSAVMGANLSEISGEVDIPGRCGVSLMELHPDYAWLRQFAPEEADFVAETAASAAFFNALDDQGLVVAVKVMALVW